MPTRPLRASLAAILLWALATGIGVPASLAGEIDHQLDEIMEATGSGVVRLEVRRPWGHSLADASSSGKTHAVRRIQGSGIVWGGGEYILTVSDLAQPGDTLLIRCEDGVVRTADYVAQDVDLGLSLIRLSGPSDLHAIERGVPSPLETRGWVLVLGYQTATRNRQLSVNRVRALYRGRGHWRARLDAIPGPGLAGGGVLDSEGRLIGLLLGEGSESVLLSAGPKRSNREYCMGAAGPSLAGWVIPIDRVTAMVDSIRDRGFQQAGFLGVRTHLPENSRPEVDPIGVSIADVVPGSPADQAGIRVGDQLVRFSGELLQGWDDLTTRVTATASGSSVEIRFIRDGQERKTVVRLADRAHTLWREQQKRLAGGRERMLRKQIQGLQQELELLRHQLAVYR